MKGEIFFGIIFGLTLFGSRFLDAESARETDIPSSKSVQAAAYQVVFNLNYGDKTAFSLLVKEGAAIRTETPVRNGWTFTGWYYDAACTRPLASGTTASISIIPDKTLTLFAGWKEWDQATTAYMTELENEMNQARYITNRPHAYERTSFLEYIETFSTVWFSVESLGTVSDGSKPINGFLRPVEVLRSGREKLERIADPEKNIWYIWDSKPPQTGKSTSYDFYRTFDTEDFKPFIVPYLLKDQTKVKANLFVIAGGSFTSRTNSYEGYLVAEKFNGMGYNCFVLQRRVAPYQPEDSALDLQRAIRYVRFNAEKLGIAKTENTAAVGFSGGGGTIMLMLSNLYHNDFPSKVDPSYKPDAVDAVDSSLDVALPIYSGGSDSTGRDGFLSNPKLPAFFFCTGEDDTTVGLEAIDTFRALKALPQELHLQLFIVSDSMHGFGTGQGKNPQTFRMQYDVNAAQWVSEADIFMDIQFGYRKQFLPLKNWLEDPVDTLQNTAPVDSGASSSRQTQTPVDEATAAYRKTLRDEYKHYQYITARAKAYDKESYDAYEKTASPLTGALVFSPVIPNGLEGIAAAAKSAREKLRLRPGITNPEQVCWYIWGSETAKSAESGNYDFSRAYDGSDFVPFIVPYMLEDQGKVKGNIILAAGGGFTSRADRYEAYPAAEKFNTLGYNCFVLQYRLKPWPEIDGSLDLQRSVRYLKYNSAKYNIAKIGNIAAAGFSAGGSVINTQIERLYGLIHPNTVYPDYKGDDIDKENADIDIMMLIYSARELNTENPAIPDAFCAVGVNDSLSMSERQVNTIRYYIDKGIRYEAHFFSDVGHGFGVGHGLNSENMKDMDVANVEAWPVLADAFMSIKYGYLTNVIQE
jgi:uncharacterized repeat protein (TIGR02543 family)